MNCGTDSLLSALVALVFLRLGALDLGRLMRFAPLVSRLDSRLVVPVLVVVVVVLADCVCQQADGSLRTDAPVRARCRQRSADPGLWCWGPR